MAENRPFSGAWGLWPSDFGCHYCLRCQVGSSNREAWHFYGSYKFSTGVYMAFSWHFANNYLSFQSIAEHALISRNVSQMWDSLAGQMPGHSAGIELNCFGQPASRPIALLTEPLKLGRYRIAGNGRLNRFGPVLFARWIHPHIYVFRFGHRRRSWRSRWDDFDVTAVRAAQCGDLKSDALPRYIFRLNAIHVSNDFSDNCFGNLIGRLIHYRFHAFKRLNPLTKFRPVLRIVALLFLKLCLNCIGL